MGDDTCVWVLFGGLFMKIDIYKQMFIAIKLISWVYASSVSLKQTSY